MTERHRRHRSTLPTDALAYQAELLARAAPAVEQAEQPGAALALHQLQLRASRKLNTALTRMLQHEQARSHRLALELEAERKRGAAQSALQAARDVDPSSDSAAVFEAEAAEAAGAAHRAEAAVAEARGIEDSFAANAVAAVADAESADAEVLSKGASSRAPGAEDIGVDSILRSMRLTGGVRRLLRSVPPARASHAAHAASSDIKADRLPTSSTTPSSGYLQRGPNSSRRPRSAGFLLKRGGKPLRLGMVIPTGSDDRGLLHPTSLPTLSMPAPFEWPEDIASPAPRKLRTPTAGTTTTWTASPRSGSPRTPNQLSSTSSPRRQGGPAVFSSALLARMQSELQSELLRLQEETQQLIEGCAAGNVSAGEGGPAGGNDRENSSMASSVRSLSRRLGWIRSDLNVLRQMAPNRENSLEMSRLRDVASAAEEFARSLRGELANDRHRLSDAGYADALEDAGLRRIEVARDGNCLFACAAAFLNRSGIGNGLHDTSVATHTARSLRLAAIATLRGALAREEAHEASCILDTALRVGSAVGGVGERIDAAIAEALCSGSNDASTTALRRRLAAGSGSTDKQAPSVTFSGCQTDRVDERRRIGGAEARRIYLDLMATDGVFGERLEIEALASVLRTPVFMYYSFEQRGDDATAAAIVLSPADNLPVPVEIIEPNPALLPPDSQPASPARATPVPQSPISASAVRTAKAVASLQTAGDPMRLLHLVSARHFDLLLPLD